MTTPTKDAMKFTVHFERKTDRQMNQDKLNNALNKIGSAARRNKTYNFETSIPRSAIVINPIAGGGWHYHATIIVWKDNFRSAGAVREQFESIKPVMARAANTVKWTMKGEENSISPEPVPPPKEDKPVKKIVNNIDIELPELTADIYSTYFHRLYNREPQIRIIYDSAITAVRSKFRERHHVLLRGLAGTAKTDLFTSFCDFIGQDKVWKVDATTLTKAGLERELIRRSMEGSLQPFVLVEEIEKVTSPENINSLLQVMDTRGKIQRTNARDGDIYADCRVVVWATCNNSDYLRTFADGAIWSRFSLRPICKRPDEALMHKILTRSVLEMGGNVAWVDPIIRFMWDKLKLLREYKKDYNDPRLGRALLSGGDRVLDNSDTGFFADFLACCEGTESGEQTSPMAKEQDD